MRFWARKWRKLNKHFVANIRCLILDLTKPNRFHTNQIGSFVLLSCFCSSKTVSYPWTMALTEYKLNKLKLKKWIVLNKLHARRKHWTYIHTGTFFGLSLQFLRIISTNNFRTPWDGMLYFDRQMQRIQEAFEQLDTQVCF